jgi:hypothetical protein
MALVVQPVEQGSIEIQKHYIWKQLDEATPQLIRASPGSMNIGSFRLSVLDVMHFLSASWNVVAQTVIISC